MPTGPDTLTVDVLEGSSGHLNDLAPGDHTEWAAQVTNTGPTPTAIKVSVRVTGTDALINDPVDGLQLAVDLCPADLTTTTLPSGARQFTCPAQDTRLGEGPAAQLAVAGLVTHEDVAPSGTVAVRVRVRLPATAGNNLENTAGELHVNFVSADHPGPPSPTAPGIIDVRPEPPGARPEPGTDPLPVTGRDILAAMAGALISTVTGLLFLAVSRRHRTTNNGKQ